MWYSKNILESNPRKLLSNCLHKALLRQHMGLIRSQTFLAVSVTPARPLGASSSNRLPYSSQS